jgi:hypothetical protein
LLPQEQAPSPAPSRNAFYDRMQNVSVQYRKSIDTELTTQWFIVQYRTVHALSARTAGNCYLYCITQKIPCFFHSNMLEFKLRKCRKNQFFIFENSGFLQRKEYRFYVFIRLCLG